MTERWKSVISLQVFKGSESGEFRKKQNKSSKRNKISEDTSPSQRIFTAHKNLIHTCFINTNN